MIRCGKHGQSTPCNTAYLSPVFSNPAVSMLRMAAMQQGLWYTKGWQNVVADQLLHYASSMHMSMGKITEAVSCICIISRIWMHKNSQTFLTKSGSLLVIVHFTQQPTHINWVQPNSNKSLGFCNSTGTEERYFHNFLVSIFAGPTVLIDKLWVQTWLHTEPTLIHWDNIVLKPSITLLHSPQWSTTLSWNHQAEIWKLPALKLRKKTNDSESKIPKLRKTKQFRIENPKTQHFN